MTLTPKQEKQRRANARPAAIERRRKYASSAQGKTKARERRATQEGRNRERENQRKRHYGMEPGEWDAMFLSQGSRCAICSSTEHGGRYWHTDHCHASGKVRGIVCHHCNHMLGGAKDNISNLLSAVNYLGAAA